MSTELMKQALAVMEENACHVAQGAPSDEWARFCQTMTTLSGAKEWPIAPRQWQGLTEEEIAELHHEIKVRLIGTYKTEDIYRAIEAKLKEKNT